MPKILLAEDDGTMISLLKTLLELEGYQVIAIVDQDQEGLIEVIRENKPEITLIDVNMRHANGFNLLKQMRADDELREIRVVLSSGMEYSMESRQAGADGFILKPYNPDELISVIRNLTKT